MDKSIPQQLHELEKKWGITAYNELLDIFAKQEMERIRYRDSRDKWKNKYKNLKLSLKNGR